MRVEIFLPVREVVEGEVFVREAVVGGLIKTQQNKEVLKIESWEDW